MRNSLLPVLVFGTIFGYFPINEIESKSIATRVHKTYKVITCSAYIMGICLMLNDITGTFSYKIAFDVAQQYCQLGNNLCTVSYFFVAFLIGVSSLKNSRKVKKFYTAVVDIDETLSSFCQPVNYWCTFIRCCLTVVLVLSMILCLQYYSAKTNIEMGGIENINVSIIICYSVVPYSSATQMILFNTHISEVTGRYMAMNKTFDR